VTLPYDSPIAPVVAMAKGTESRVAELGFLQVFVLSVEPSIVLPSAPEVLQYRFQINGEGVQDSDIKV